MEYIVIEEFNDQINLVVGDGKPFITGNLEEAEDLLSQLQGGFIFPLCDIINFAKCVVNNPEGFNASVEIRFEMKQLLGK